MADEIPMFVETAPEETFTPSTEPTAQVSDAQAMADAMVKFGHWTPEQAAAHMASTDDDEGITPTTTRAVKQELPEGIDQITYEAFAPAKSASEYRFEQPAIGSDLKADLAQEIEVREIFHRAEVPPAVGNEVSRLWARACASPPSAAQLEVSRQQCEQTLARAWGTDFDKNLGIAVGEIKRIAGGNQKLIDMLEMSGLGNSAWLAQTLVNAAKARGRAR